MDKDIPPDTEDRYGLSAVPVLTSNMDSPIDEKETYIQDNKKDDVNVFETGEETPTRFSTDAESADVIVHGAEEIAGFVIELVSNFALSVRPPLC